MGEVVDADESKKGSNDKVVEGYSIPMCDSSSNDGSGVVEKNFDADKVKSGENVTLTVTSTSNIPDEVKSRESVKLETVNITSNSTGSISEEELKVNYLLMDY